MPQMATLTSGKVTQSGAKLQETGCKTKGNPTKIRFPFHITVRPRLEQPTNKNQDNGTAE